MSMVINTNVASLTAQRNLSNTQNAVSTASQRLSSGLRINSAKDDAAGLGISQQMSAQLKSVNQGIRNANDGVSMIQTAEGALDQVQVMMQRMRELATQGASDTVGSTERGYINTELQQMLTEINNIATRTKFNGNNLLNGSLTTAQDTATSTALIGDGAGANATITGINVSGAKAGTTYTFSDNAGVLTLSDGTMSQSIDLSSAAANANNTSVLSFDQLGVSISVTEDSTGQAGTVTTAGLDGLTIDTAAGSGSATLQIGADFNSSNQVTLAFADARIQTGNSNIALAGLATALATFNGTQNAANSGALLTAVDGALNAISSQRSTYGAAQNRLTNAVANQQVTSENLSAARSQITDADFAAETAALTRGQILQQAGQAMLAQANSAPNQVLSLLRNLG